jgi:hypothetical protein
MNAVDLQRKHTIYVNWTSTCVNVEHMLAELSNTRTSLTVSDAKVHRPKTQRTKDSSKTLLNLSYKQRNTSFLSALNYFLSPFLVFLISFE